MKKYITILLIIILLSTVLFLTFRKTLEPDPAAAETKDHRTKTISLNQKENWRQRSAVAEGPLDVPLLNQMDAPRLYNGCEVTSLAMVLQYEGFDVSKNELAEKINTVPLTYDNGERGDPNEGFVGDMANGPGLGVYDQPIAELASAYAGDSVVNLTGKSAEEAIYQPLDNGHPVWIITTSSFSPVRNMETWDTPNGEVEVTFSVHSVAVTGYDDTTVYLNNPYGTKDQAVDRENFEAAWEQMGSQAIIID